METGGGGFGPLRKGPLEEVARACAAASALSFAAFCVALALNARSPEGELVVLAGVAAAVSTTTAAGSGTAWVASKAKVKDFRQAIALVGVLALATLLLHLSVVNATGVQGCVVSGAASSGCISDEIYYVPAASTLIAGTQCSPSVAGCNLEHPFLGKAIVAAGMAVFGADALGERVGSIVFGTLSIPVVFLLALAATGDRKLGYASALLLALDPLFFSQSSAAFIDVPSLFISLCAFLVYFAKVRLWKLDELALAGVLFGVAALAKETAIFMFLALVVYHTLFKEGTLGAWAKDLFKMGGATALVFAGGMQAYDSLLAGGTYPYFYQQVMYILTYGASLLGGGWTDNVLGTPITPLNWVTYYSPVGYLVSPSSMSVTGPGGVALYPSVAYYASIDLVLSWTLYLWVALAAVLAFGYLRTRTSLPSLGADVRYLFFQGVWFACVFVPYTGLWLFGRDTYPFYIIIATPAMAGGTGYLLTRSWFNRWAALLVFAAAALGFVYFFPVKGFMPVWLRALFPR